MQDATILANCLYDLEDLSPESILKTFSDYRDQRYTHARKQVANSQLNAKISSGQVQDARFFLSAFDWSLSHHLRLPLSLRVRLFVAQDNMPFLSLLFFSSLYLSLCLSPCLSLLLMMATAVCPLAAITLLTLSFRFSYHSSFFLCMWRHIGEQTLKEKVIRHVVLNFLPQWVFSLSFVKSAAYRPQVTFLPMVPDKGSVASLPQKLSKRHQAEQAGQVAVVGSV